MYKLILTTIVISFFLNLQAQESFFKRYPNLVDLAYESVESINRVDGEYVYLYSSGAFSSEEPFHWDMITRKVNTLNGELIWKKYNHIPDYGMTPTCSFINPNNNIIISGLLTSNENKYLYKINRHFCELRN